MTNRPGATKAVVVRFQCNGSSCDAQQDVSISGNQWFSKLLVNSAKPRGWRVRTPRDGPAVAYCPLHAD